MRALMLSHYLTLYDFRFFYGKIVEDGSVLLHQQWKFETTVKRLMQYVFALFFSVVHLKMPFDVLLVGSLDAFGNLKQRFQILGDCGINFEVLWQVD